MAKRRELVATSVGFYSPGDEDAFIAWMNSIGCVGELHGVGRALLIPVTRRPSNADLRELLACFRRYQVDLRQLARFASGPGREWFASPQADWHFAVFGGD